MCLGIPMKLISKTGNDGVVESGGLKRRVNLSLLKQASLGQYLLIHAGFAIEIIKEKEARITLDMLKAIK